MQFLVDRLQLLLGGFEFLIRRLLLLVDRDQLFVRRLQLFQGGLIFFDHCLKTVAGLAQLPIDMSRDVRRDRLSLCLLSGEHAAFVEEQDQV